MGDSGGTAVAEMPHTGRMRPTIISRTSGVLVALAAVVASTGAAESGASLPAGWSIAIERGEGHALGRAAGGVVTLWPDMADDEDHLAWVRLHETGHAWDLAALDDAARSQWAEMRGAESGADWWQGDLTARIRQWSDIPAEDLADAYAYCHMPRDDYWHSTVAGPPSAAECAWLRRVLSTV